MTQVIEPRLWGPQAGPQLAAIEADWCFELFYGGGKYGGKSIFMLLDYLKDVEKYGRHWQGMLFRESYPELEQIIADSWKIYPQTGAIYEKQPKTWKWPNGASLKFRNLDSVEAATAYNGHCVGKGTPVLMADWTVKPIEDVQTGESVQTLNGPRRVLETHRPGRKVCVVAFCRGVSQLMPLEHPILTSDGWQSYASLLGISPKEIEGRGPGLLRLPPVNVSARCLEHLPLAVSSRSCDGATLSRELSQSSVASPDHNLSTFQRLLRRLLGLGRASAPTHGTLRCIGRNRAFDGIRRELSGLGRALSFLGDYRFLRYLCGGRPLCPSGIVRESLLRPADAAAPFPANYMQDVMDDIPLHTHSGSQRYDHPYSGREIEATEASAFYPCNVAPYGLEEVFDLTVEDVNHYITASSGLINKNSYPWLGGDEIANYPTPDVLFVMLGCVRWGERHLPTMRVRLTGNPGFAGHHWVKVRYVDPCPTGYKPIKDPGDVRERMFIPSTLRDNKIGLRNDPHYAENLSKMYSPELVRALLYGEWDIQVASFFPEFSKKKHTCVPFEIPEYWFKFRSFDWGGAKPFAVQWWAVSDGREVICLDGTKLYVPRGCLVCYREWYGMVHNKPNVGVRMRNEDIADGILMRTQGREHIGFTTTDNLPFQVRGGPSIAEVFHKRGVPLKLGNTDRVTGWSQLRGRLIGTEEGPMMLFFQTCEHSIRTLPALQTDKHRFEDVDTKCEDHCFTADTLVQTPNGPKCIADLPVSGQILRGDGTYGPYHSRRLVKANAQIVRLEFSDGWKVRCTPDHKFLTENGWVTAENLTDTIRLCRVPLLSARRFKNSSEKGIGFVAHTSSEGERGSTERSGLTHMARSLTECMSIIRTTIERITNFPTWSYYPRPNTQSSTGKTQRVSGGQERASSWLGATPLSGTRVQRGEPGTKSTTTSLLIAFIKSTKKFADTAVSRTLQVILGADSARGDASRDEPVCLKNRTDEGFADVFCVTVPEVESFALANGLVVANCPDATRLACMERPLTKDAPEDRPDPFQHVLTFNELLKYDELHRDDD